MSEDQARVLAYLNEVVKGMHRDPEDPIGHLIESHKRQREIVKAAIDADHVSLSRLRWLPWPVKRWMLGY
jgi:hypothetical protein